MSSEHDANVSAATLHHLNEKGAKCWKGSHQQINYSFCGCGRRIVRIVTVKTCPQQVNLNGKRYMVESI